MSVLVGPIGLAVGSIVHPLALRLRRRGKLVHINVVDSAFRVAPQPQQSQAVHVFDRRFVPRVFLLESLIYFHFSPLASVKRRFGGFATLCIHRILPFLGDGR